VVEQNKSQAKWDGVPSDEQIRLPNLAYSAKNISANSSFSKKKTKRIRGTHSTACKCPNPVFFRDPEHKKLPGEYGRALNNLCGKNRDTGEMEIRRRISCDPYFSFVLAKLGRMQRIKAVVCNLMDVMAILLLCKTDFATGIMTVNLSGIAEDLSPKDENGEVILETAVTVSRISRMVMFLISCGVLYADPSEFDVKDGTRFPKHVMLTDVFWRLTGVDVEKIRHEQEIKLNGTPLTDARKIWHANCRQATIIKRRSNAAKSQQRKKLAAMPFDGRKREVAERLRRQLGERIHLLTSEQFNKLVRNNLWQMELVDLGSADPINAPPN
jgi:hypothetical protein